MNDQTCICFSRAQSFEDLIKGDNDVPELAAQQLRREECACHFAGHSDVSLRTILSGCVVAHIEPLGIYADEERKPPPPMLALLGSSVHVPDT